MFFLVPIGVGILYTVMVFSNAHCNNFECKELKTPVKFEQVKPGQQYPTK